MSRRVLFALPDEYDADQAEKFFWVYIICFLFDKYRVFSVNWCISSTANGCTKPFRFFSR